MSIVKLTFADGTEYQLAAETVEYEPIYAEVTGVCGEVISRISKGFVATINVKADNPISALKKENEVLRRRLQHLLESDYIASFDKKKLGTNEYVRDIKEADRDSVPSAAKRATAGLIKAARVMLETAENIEKQEGAR